MLYLGSHVSFRKQDQLLGSVLEAESYGANTFMFYTGAPQNTLRFPIDEVLSIKALTKMKESGFDLRKIIVHAPYIINLANGKEKDKWEFSVRFLKEELSRCEELGMSYLVLHPGSHVGLGIGQGIRHIIFALNDCLMNTNVTILLETMAGKGSEVGSKLEEIKQIIDGVEYKDKIGVCLDTCHLHDSGYDIENFNDFLAEFDKIIGINYLRCIHINDSKNELGAKKDRHENIGYGKIGFDTLVNIVHHPLLDDIPKILETPYILDQAPYKKEIEMLKAREFDSTLKMIE